MLFILSRHALNDGTTAIDYDDGTTTPNKKSSPARGATGLRMSTGKRREASTGQPS
jgi:hypothetical protein